MRRYYNNCPIYEHIYVTTRKSPRRSISTGVTGIVATPISILLTQPWRVSRHTVIAEICFVGRPSDIITPRHDIFVEQYSGHEDISLIAVKNGTPQSKLKDSVTHAT